jgi:MFS family permease
MIPKRWGKIPLPTFAGALRSYNFRLWFLGQSVSLIGSWMQIVAQQWIVYAMTGSKWMLGLVTFANSLPMFFLMLPAGVLADRLPRRTILLCTQTAMMILAFLLAALLGFGRLQIGHLFILAALLGVANSLDAPARQAIAVDIIEERRDLINAIALNSTMFNLARIIGPVVAGMVLAEWGAVWCFGVNGASFLAVLIGLILMRIPATIGRTHEEPSRQIMDGLQYALHHPVILPLILNAIATNIFAMSYSTLLPAFVVEVLHGGEKMLGILLAALGLGALIGSLAMATLSHLSYGARALVWGGILFPAALLVFAFSPVYLLSLGLLVVAGFGMVAQNTSANTIIQMLVSDERRGRVMSIYLLAFFGAALFGALLAGFIAQEWGAAAGVGITAAASLVCFIGILFSAPQLRRI